MRTAPLPRRLAAWLVAAWAGLAGGFGSESPPRLGELGLPPVAYHDPGRLGFAQKIAALSWDPRGVLYASHDQGIARYDGLRWQRVPGIREGVTALRPDGQGGLHFATYGGLGYREVQEDGSTATRTLLSWSEDASRRAAYIVWIELGEEQVCFVSLDSVYAFDRQTGEPAFEAKIPDGIGLATMFRGQLHLASQERGLLRVSPEGAYETAPGFEGFAEAGHRLVALEEGIDGKLHALLADGRSLAYDGARYRFGPGPGSVEAEGRMHLFQKRDGGFAVLRGKKILEFDSAWRLRRAYALARTDLGLGVDAATLSPDRRQLWLGLGSHAVRIDLQSPTTLFLSEQGIDGRVGDVASHQGELYALVGGQLARAERDERGGLRFEKLEAPEDFSILAIESSSEGLILGTKEGLLRYDGERFQDAASPPSEDGVRAPYEGPSTLVCRRTRSLHIYARREGRWPSEPDIVELEAMPYMDLVAPDGAIWLEHGIGSVSRVTREAEGFRVRRYGEKNGLPEEWIEVVELDGETYFVTDGGLLRFEEAGERFILTDRYRQIYEAADRPRRVWQGERGRLWVSTADQLGFLRKASDGDCVLNARPFEGLEGLFPEILTIEPDGKVWFSCETGLGLYDPAVSSGGGDPPRAALAGVELMGESRPLHLGLLGLADAARLSRTLESDQNALRVELSAPPSRRSSGLSFQYRLRPDEAWSRPSAKAEVELIGLKPGRYRFEARAVDRSGRTGEPAALAFQIAKPFSQTPLAYALYGAGGLAALSVIAPLWNLGLKRRNRLLAQQVANRTRQLEAQSAELRRALAELQASQDEVARSARMAGMAEVATDVLHNVGNVMNSLVVSIDSLGAKLAASKVGGLRKLADLVSRQGGDLSQYFGVEGKGPQALEYLNCLGETLEAERDACAKEVEEAKRHLAHAASIISSQQRHARKAGVEERFLLREAVLMAAKLGLPERLRDRVELSIDAPEDLQVELDSHLLVQMLTNLVKNAAESIGDAETRRGRIELKTGLEAGGARFRVSVSDNGGGFEAERLKRLFEAGYTTKAYGSGFGLHSVANLARALGGSISIASDGPGEGATATLELPRRCGIGAANPPAPS